MSHHHHHHHTASENIGLAFWLNLCFTVIEFIGGLLTNSTAILADAMHDLGDTISLGMAWVLQKLSSKHPTENFTYGFQRLTLVGAFINSGILIAGSVWILFEAIPRLFDPVMPVAEGMLGLAILGITVNGYAAYRVSSGKSMNERVLSWHLLEDVLGWVAVLVVSVVLMFVEIPILDPILSILFTLFILFNVYRNFAQTIKLFVQGVPDPKLYGKIKQQLTSLEQVAEVHHLHLWSLDGESHILTAHLVVNDELSAAAREQLKQSVQTTLAPFAFKHTTIELEYPSETCRDHDDRVGS